eukprot:10236-Chlamydomonas_euryale.AAC.1
MLPVWCPPVVHQEVPWPPILSSPQPPRAGRSESRALGESGARRVARSKSRALGESGARRVGRSE